MNRNRTASVLVGIVAAGGLLFAATPAWAAVAVLPEQDDLYGITSYNELEGLGENLQLVSLDPTNADATPVGSGTEVENFDSEGQAAYDVSRDVSWLTYYSYDPIEEEDSVFLAWIDVATGVTTTVGEVVDSEGDVVYVNGVMVGTDGVIYAIDDSDYSLWTLNPETGAATLAVPEVGHFHAYAYNPVTDAFYGISHEGIYDLWEIDVETGALTLIAEQDAYFPEDASDSHSMQFDSNGVLWFQTWLGEEQQVIATYTLESGIIAEIVGEPNFNGGDISVSPTILITRGAPAVVVPVEPALAATGSETAPIILFGGLLLAAGGSLIVARAASRRAAA